MTTKRRSQIPNPKATGTTARLLTEYVASAVQAHGRWQDAYMERLTHPDLQDAAEYDAAIDDLITITKDILNNLEIARSMGSR